MQNIPLQANILVKYMMSPALLISLQPLLYWPPPRVLWQRTEGCLPRPKVKLLQLCKSDSALHGIERLLSSILHFFLLLELMVGSL